MSHSRVSVCVLLALSTVSLCRLSVASPAIRLDFSPDPPEAAGGAAAVREASGATNVLHTGRGLSACFPRQQARPGERWVSGRLDLSPTGTPLAECRVRATLGRLGDAEVLEQAVATPARTRCQIRVDMRSHDLVAAELLLEFLERDIRSGVAKVLLTAEPAAKALRRGQRIPVSLDLPDGIEAVESWPVTFGVPFPAGALWGPELPMRLVAGDGSGWPCQAEVTGRWAVEGAVKWVRFDALVDSGKGCSVEVGEAPTPRPEPSVRLERRDDAIVVDTGAAAYALGPGHSLIREIGVGGRRIVSGEGARGLFVIDQNGALAGASGGDVRRRWRVGQRANGETVLAVGVRS